MLSSRDFNMTPTKDNFCDKRVDRKEDSHRTAQAKAYKQRHCEPPPPPLAVDHCQGVYQPHQPGLKPLPSPLRDEEMVSVANTDVVLKEKS